MCTGSESYDTGEPLSSGEIGQTTEPCPLITETPPAQQPEPPVDIRVSVFFDGTLNNRTNTARRIRRMEEHRISPDIPDWNPSHFGADSSYENDYSNVAILETNLQCPDHIPPNQYHFSLYIEGMGTVNGAADDPQGTAVGSGTTGIEARVTGAVYQIIDRIRGLRLGENRTINILKVSSFGFSRGAAAARHFVYKVLQSTEGWKDLKTRIQRQLGYTVTTIEFPFIGLFDTVSSYDPDFDISPQGAYETLHPDFSDDAPTLHLAELGRVEVKKVVQLAAADEHRKNFSLTEIESAGSNGIQMFLPGVHSDIGGGYTNSFDEGLLPIREISHRVDDGPRIQEIMTIYRNDADNLENLGWFQRRNFEPYPAAEDSVTHPYTYAEILQTRRGRISNFYRRVPLHLMAMYGRENGLTFTDTLTANYPISGTFLTEVNQRLNQYNDRLRGTGGSSIIDWSENTEQWVKDLRRDFLHFSAHYRRTVLADTITLIPHEPSIIDGQRRRVKLPG